MDRKTDFTRVSYPAKVSWFNVFAVLSSKVITQTAE